MRRGLRQVSCKASQVRPLRSPAMVFAATAGPIQVTTAYAKEKKVWKIPTPTLAGSAVVLATPPTEQIRSVIMPVTTDRMIGARCKRAACFNSRIQTGLGAPNRRTQGVSSVGGADERDAGAGGRLGEPTLLVIAGPPA